MHARRTVPFYRDRLGAVIDGDRLNWSGWRDLPILTREEVFDRRDALTSCDVPAEHGKVASKTTSGSIGKPLTVLMTRTADLRSMGLVHRCFLWHDFDVTARMAYIMPYFVDRAQYPEAERYEYWTVPTQLLSIKGELLILSISATVEQQIEWLRRERPRYLHTFPSNARALARRLEGEPIEGLEKLFLVGESSGAELRAECQQAFAVDIVDRYGAMETGQLALQCPTGCHYHVHSENVLLEVLGPDGCPVAPGESGTVVVTTLHNYAFPLIRYRLDDIATVGSPCACGRGLPVIEEILGRTRHIFRFPDGSEIWPSLGDAIVPLAPRHWQVAQVGPLEIEVRYVPEDFGHRPDYDHVTAFIRKQFRQHVSVRYRRLDSLPALPGGKFHDYVCEL